MPIGNKATTLSTMKEPKYERDMTDLPEKDVKKLMAIKKIEDIKSVELIEIWNDDHQPCAGLKLNGVTFGMWWVSYETIAAIEYGTDSKKARKKLLEAIKYQQVRYNDLKEE